MATDPSEWSAPLPRARGDRLRAIAPAIVLTAVGLLGVRNHVLHDQSSWEGASFGMFATYEHHVSRVIEITVTGPDGPYRAVLPRSLRDDAVKFRVAPSQGAANRLARQIAALVPDSGTTKITIELWRVALEHGDDGLRLRLDRMLTGTAVP